jgi:hypothetical protein
MITKPVASFKSMAGLDPTRHYVGSLLRRAGGTALGLVAGNKLSDRHADSGRDTPPNATAPGEVTPSTTYAVQPVEPSMPSLAPPTTVQALPAGTNTAPRLAGRVGADQSAIRGRTVTDPAHPALPARVRISPNALPIETGGEVPPNDAPRRRPVTVVPIVAGAVAARRPVVTEYTAFPPAGWRSEHAMTGPDDRPAIQPARRSPVDPRAAARAAETSVTYPTGIVVQNEPNLYRPSSPLRIEEYLWFPEPQLDANGEETWTPLYHARTALYHARAAH